MSLLPRPELRTLPSGHHGGIDYAEAEALGLDPGEMLDFSANLNPFGPPPGVARAVAGAELSQYPDSRSRRLTLALAEKLGVQPDRILPTSGSTELIRLAALAYFGKGDRVLIIEPTFDEYELACCIAGASVVKQRLSPHDEFQLDTAETVKLIRRHRPKGIFICNPNNPTGRYFSRSEFQEILAAAGDCLVTLDEAYLSFVDSPWSSLEMPGRSNVLVLRSMTKDYAMAGLRLGYGVAAPDIIATLRRVCAPWNVNSPAQRAGIAALRHDHYLERCQRKLKRAKRYLESELSALGLPPLPSEANFFLVDVGDAGAFRQSLLQKRMLVRDCSSFGLPHHIRIAPRTLSDCRRLVAAIKEIGPGRRAMNSLLSQTLEKLEPPDAEAMKAAQARQDELTKPKGSLGRLEELSVKLAGMKGGIVRGFEHKVIVTMAADHGVVTQGVALYPQEVTRQMVFNFLNGGAAINVLTRSIGARVVVVDMGVVGGFEPDPRLVCKMIDFGTRDMTRGPAMSRQQALDAIESGIQVVDSELAKGLDIVGTGDMGIGNTTASSAICAAVTGQPAEEVTGRGTGLDGEQLAHKVEMVRKALEVNKPDPKDPLDVLSKVGGFEIGGLAGVMMGAAANRVPVVVDGFISTAAALIATELAPRVKDYLIAAHLSAEKGHRLMLQHMGLTPLLDLQMRLGEGTGAAIAMVIVEAAAKVLAEMATFADANVSKAEHAEE